MFFRSDRGTVGELERTPQGGLVVPAFLTRAGVFEYEQPDGKVIREWRPKSEVFNKDALSTLPNATLTNRHPTEHVHPGNFKKHVVGHVETDSVKAEGDKVAARLVVQDGRTIRDLGVGTRREVSCGYHCDVDDKPGIVPDGEPDAGKPYDRIQRSIRYNHVALVDDGRAGPDVRLRLDSRGNQKTQGEAEMEFELIDGVKHEVGTPGHADAVRRRNDAVEKTRKDATDALATEKKRADDAEAKVKKLEEQLVEATSAKRIDEAVRVRAAVISRAKVVLGDKFKFDGMSNHAIKVAAVKKARPELKLDGVEKPADYIRGLFDGLPTKREDSRRSPNANLHLDEKDRVEGGEVPEDLRDPPEGFERQDVGEQPRRGGRTISQIRADRDNEQRHKKPLTVSKSNASRLQGSQLETMR